MLYEIRVLKNCEKFIGKHLCWSLFLITLQTSNLQLYYKETHLNLDSRYSKKKKTWFPGWQEKESLTKEISSFRDYCVFLDYCEIDKWKWHSKIKLLFFVSQRTSRNQAFSIFKPILSRALNITDSSERLLSKVSFSIYFGIQAKSCMTVEGSNSVNIYITVNQFKSSTKLHLMSRRNVYSHGATTRSFVQQNLVFSA